MKRLALVVSCAALLLPASALAKDYASTALNIIPSGQYGDVPIPPGADSPGEDVRRSDAAVRQRDHGRSLQVLQVRAALGTKGQGKLRVERPRKGVTIVRDRYDVPHIYREDS